MSQQVPKKIRKDLPQPKMSLKRKADGWWITGRPARAWRNESTDAGPYTTKAEAAEEIRGLARMYQEHPELIDPWYGYEFRKENLELGSAKERPKVESEMVLASSTKKPVYESKEVVEPFELMIQKFLPKWYVGKYVRAKGESVEKFLARVRQESERRPLPPLVRKEVPSKPPPPLMRKAKLPPPAAKPAPVKDSLEILFDDYED